MIDAAGTADQADMVVIAIPAHHIIPLIPTLTLRPGTLVLDLGSTKTRICNALDRLPPDALSPEFKQSILDARAELAAPAEP